MFHIGGVLPLEGHLEWKLRMKGRLSSYVRKSSKQGKWGSVLTLSVVNQFNSIVDV